MCDDRKKAMMDEAKTLESSLSAEGRHLEAQAIKRLRLSVSAQTGHLKRLFRDNARLRRLCGERMLMPID